MNSRTAVEAKNALEENDVAYGLTVFYLNSDDDSSSFDVGTVVAVRTMANTKYVKGCDRIKFNRQYKTCSMFDDEYTIVLNLSEHLYNIPGTEPVPMRVFLSENQIIVASNGMDRSMKIYQLSFIEKSVLRYALNCKQEPFSIN